MTFPSYRHLLDLKAQPRHPELGEVRAIQPFAFVARRAGRSVGLALADAPLERDDQAPPQLLSVFVRPEERRQGVGTALVAAVEEAARERGFKELAAVYTTGKPAIEWLDRIFSRQGWQPPEPGSLTVSFRPRNALASPAFEERLLRAYARGLEIFPWSELTAEEEEEMRRSNQERCWIEPSLEPWQFDPGRLDSSSVGARYRRRVVGWVINHRIVPGLVRFSVSYLRRDLSRRGGIMALYHASLRHIEGKGSSCYCTFITPFSYPRMVAFVRRWIAPISSFVGESRRRCISLRPQRS